MYLGRVTKGGCCLLASGMLLFGSMSTCAAGAGVNEFGAGGLLQTPTARFAGEGELRLGYARVFPYDYLFIATEPYDWFEAIFRYSKFNNEPIGGGDVYLDKSFDFRFKLSEENGIWPAMALGFQDVGGTGFLSSEYLVASRRWNAFDLSLGVGWGRLGSRGDFGNPVGTLSDRFDEEREPSGRDAGSFTLSRLFKGERVALFGGVRWRPEGAPYSIVVEREGNNYQAEPFDNNLKVHFPVNVGVDFDLPGMKLGIAYERGDQLTFRAALYDNFQRSSGPPKALDPPGTPVGPTEYAPQPVALDSETAREQDEDFIDDLRASLARQGFSLTAIGLDRPRRRVTIWFSEARFRNPATAFGRVSRSAASLAPAVYESFTVIATNDSVEEYRATVDRAAVRDVANGVAPLGDFAKQVSLEPSGSGSSAADRRFVAYPWFDWGMGPRIRQNLGDPNGLWYGQLWWSVSGDLHVTDRLSISSGLGFNIINNFDDIERESNSVLPHVRSDIKEYLQEGENSLVRLEANYIRPLAPEWFGRLSAGIFEQMYGGVAAEVLYRPFGQPWAFGVDVNRVRQRDYDQRFSFLDYEVTTGHATLYYEVRPLKMRVILSAGRYLAGDHGATLDLSREFSSGARMGVFATKTDASAEEFGEGRFDKGFYISMPLDLFFPWSSKRTAAFSFRPLTRDGGQKVDAGRSLYYETGDNSLFDFADGWPQVMN